MPPVIKKQAPVAARKKTGNSILDRIVPVSDPSLRKKGITMCIYGRSGTGKTRLASTFPKPALIIGTEDGTESVRETEGLTFIYVQESTEIGVVLNASVDMGYKTLIIDTASALQDLVMKEILGLEELPVQRSWGMATREQWSQGGVQIKEYLRAALNLREKGVHIVIVAQEREFDNGENSEVILPSVGAALTPSVAGWLAPACNYVAQTFIREEVKPKKIKVGDKEVTTQEKTGKFEYCLRVGPHNIFTTKFRLPPGHELPDAITNPTYDKVAKLIGV